MLTHRAFMEQAEAAWLLGSHSTKEDAAAAEKYLLRRVKGCTFQKMTDAQVGVLPSEEDNALKILAEHGRMADFPLFTQNKKRFARNGAFVTEACNLIEGMRVAFYSEDQAAGGKHGKRQSFNWTPITINSKPFSGYVHGITVTPPVSKYNFHSLPLYFAGNDILVHNTGADADSLDKTAQDFNCIQLPLTTTYRCPKAVVGFAQQWVSHITAAETTPQGKISYSTMEQFFARNDLNGEAAVLSRTTKPLVALASILIRKRIPCRIEGRDVGNKLVKMLQRWKVATLDDLEDRLDTYLAKETTKLLAKKQETKLAEVEDVVETIRVIIDQCRAEGRSTVADAIAYVEGMFSDNVTSMLVLSTIHKAKGREWKRVFWLDRAGTCPNKWARQAWQQEQEKNLMYVAATRAAEELIELEPEEQLRELRKAPAPQAK